MVSQEDCSKSEILKSDKNLIGTNLSHLEATQIVKKIAPNIDITMHVETSKKAYELALHISKQYTKRDKVLILDTPSSVKNYSLLQMNNNTNFLFTDEAAELCAAIACSEDRIGAIVVKHYQFSPYYYKKVRELASAEGAIMIFDFLNIPLINEANYPTISKSSLPDILCINLALNIESIWIGGRTELMALAN